jgi:hypothetical protein
VESCDACQRRQHRLYSLFLNSRDCDASGLANSTILILLGPFQGWQSGNGFFSEIAQPDRGAAPNIGVTILERLCQGRHDFGRIALSVLQQPDGLDLISRPGGSQIFDQTLYGFSPAAADEAQRT